MPVVTAKSLLEDELKDDAFRDSYEDAEERDRLIDALIALRHTRHLTQSEVARHMGVRQNTVSGFENEATDPRLSTLQRYARAVGSRLRLRHEVCGDDGLWRTETVHAWVQAVRSGGATITEASNVIRLPNRRAWTPPHSEQFESLSANG